MMPSIELMHSRFIKNMLQIVDALTAVQDIREEIESGLYVEGFCDTHINRAEWYSTAVLPEWRIAMTIL